MERTAFPTNSDLIRLVSGRTLARRLPIAPCPGYGSRCHGSPCRRDEWIAVRTLAHRLPIAPCPGYGSRCHGSPCRRDEWIAVRTLAHRLPIAPCPGYGSRCHGSPCRRDEWIEHSRCRSSSVSFSLESFSSRLSVTLRY